MTALTQTPADLTITDEDEQIALDTNPHTLVRELIQTNRKLVGPDDIANAAFAKISTQDYGPMLHAALRDVARMEISRHRSLLNSPELNRNHPTHNSANSPLAAAMRASQDLLDARESEELYVNGVWKQQRDMSPDDVFKLAAQYGLSAARAQATSDRFTRMGDEMIKRKAQRFGDLPRKIRESILCP